MKLPFNKNPYIVTYHNKAFPLGVIQGNADFDLTPWIAGKFINCFFHTMSLEHKFNFCTFDPWGEKDGVNSSQTIKLDKNMFKELSIDIIKTVKCLMNNGYYIHGSYNEKYISAKNAYKKYDFMHVYILIGYEDDGILYSVGYTKNGKYEEFTITFDEYLDSLINSTNAFIDINTCKYHAEGNFSFNKVGFIQELSDYINSSMHNLAYSDQIYGLKAIEKLKEFTIAEDSGIDMRYMRVLMEHKSLMQLRLDYVYRDNYSDIPEKYKKISEEAKKMYLLSLKYNITKNENILKSIENGFDLILDLEKQLLPIVLNDVSNFN